MNTVGTPLSLVYIFKNRTIIFKVRMFTKVSCTSSFQWYPLDTQTCDLTIESYKYQDDLVRYYWTDEKLYRPVVVTVGRLFQYELQLPVKHENGSIPRGGKGTLYPFVRIRFRFDRKLGNNLIQVYTPTVLVVVLSWFSFWLGLDAIPGRISLLVTCMLTLVTMHSGIKSSIPPVHYITMMDLWMVCCMGMVFSAMCEFIVVKYLHWRYQQKEKLLQQNRSLSANYASQPLFQPGPEIFQEKRSAKKVLVHSTETEMLRSILVERPKPEVTDRGDEEQKGPKRPMPIYVGLDIFCRFSFPSTFCVFNAMYWPLLIYGSDVEPTETK